MLTLSDVPAESSTLDLWNELFEEAGKVGEVVSTTSCPVIRLPESYRAAIEPAWDGTETVYVATKDEVSRRRAGRMDFTRASRILPRLMPRSSRWFTLHQQRWSPRAREWWRICR
jgi:hypothetical protein